MPRLATGTPITALRDRNVARIIIVEDDEILAEIMSEALGAAGHMVSIVDDGDVALAMITAGEPDLVILDYALPGRTGMAILRDLRRVAHDALLVMMATARAGRIHIGRAAAEGVDDYIVKPFDIGDIVSRVEALLARATPRFQG
jgi:DNA-binding response OmpR family regulator